MFFKKDIELISDLSIEKTIDEIKLMTRQYGHKKNETHMFEGKFIDNQFENIHRKNLLTCVRI